jgi:hypothetical protein
MAEVNTMIVIFTKSLQKWSLPDVWQLRYNDTATSPLQRLSRHPPQLETVIR